MAAISTLGTIGDPKCLQALKDTRKRHTDTRIKTYVDEAVARIEGDNGK